MQTDAGHARRSPPLILSLLLGAVPVALLFLVVRHLGGGLIDDAFIFCRYAANIAAGQGAVFNSGERVEGFTSPAHALVTAALVTMGIEAPVAAWWVSMGAAALSLVALCLFRGAPGLCAALLAIAAAPFALWASTGMDSSLFALAITISVLMVEADLDRWRRGESPSPISKRTWFAAGSAVIVRPEGILLLMIVIAIAPRHLTSIRGVGGPLIGVAPVILLTLLRGAYYGDWVPNTFRAKVGGGGVDLWARGLDYLADSGIALAPLVLLASAHAWRVLRRRETAAVGTWITVALAAGIVFEGGDHFPMHRLAVPFIPLLCLASSRLIWSLDVPGRARSVAAAAAVCLTATCSLQPAMLERFRLELTLARTWDSMGREMLRQLGSGHSIALTNAGAIPFRTGWHTIDMIGLLDRHIAARPVRLGHGYTGHEKYDSAYVLNREPDFILIHTWIWRSIVSGDEALRRVSGDANLDMSHAPRFRSTYYLRWLAMPNGFVALYERRRGGP
ncbi:MAG: hypothetical protein HYX75_10010 [Acidobacteria bacterium]|nr:hypothetical protein [Acidobacteriota bacterium]